MTTYAIGDVQGCYDQLCRLLEQVNFDSAIDRLWFTGDLVNRGPKSLETLRLVRSLGECCRVVLGNHDLHLLAIANRKRLPEQDPTLVPVLKADDAPELLAWLRRQPLLHYDPELNWGLVHAGLFPGWDWTSCQRYALELGEILVGSGANAFFLEMYGDVPNRWSESLRGIDRWRFMVNAFTRMRYLDQNRTLEFKNTAPPGGQAPGLTPWFELLRSHRPRTVFGHWASLRDLPTPEVSPGIYCVDTGCVWGGRLTALELETLRIHTVPGVTP